MQKAYVSPSFFISKNLIDLITKIIKTRNKNIKFNPKFKVTGTIWVFQVSNI